MLSAVESTSNRGLQAGSAFEAIVRLQLVAWCAVDLRRIGRSVVIMRLLVTLDEPVEVAGQVKEKRAACGRKQPAGR